MTATKVIRNIGDHRYFVKIMFLKCLQFAGKPIHVWSPGTIYYYGHLYIGYILSHKESWLPGEKLSNIINIGLTLIPYLCLAIKIKRHWSYSLIYSSSFQKPGYISSSFPEEVSIIISLCWLITVVLQLGMCQGGLISPFI